MRAGSLSKEPVFSTLRNRFVCGYKNVFKEGFAGNSGVHPMGGNAVTTTNGAGPHNVQLFVLSEDGTVLHCMPGYWNPNDLESELQLAQKLNDIWLDKSITPDQKTATFKKLQLQHLAEHSKETIARSHLQGFDAQHIAMNAAKFPDLIEKPELLRDYKPHPKTPGAEKEAEGSPIPYEAFKTTDKIMHQRLALTPFVPYEDFDTAAFTNYGITFYDKNENELAEGGAMRTDLKKLNLHTLTHDAPGAAPPSAMVSKSAKHKPVDLVKQISELNAKNKFNEAFALADKMVRSKPGDAVGYELRAVAAFGLRLYDVAYKDATRAAWLGCRKPANAELRRLAKSYLAMKIQRRADVLRVPPARG